ncbi:glycosyltransferase [Agromyces larvae]|uniref:Glycosyltransferase n=1 Tax=Agromyces larvae TaxID=2929802 RepID=A0ABY4BU77_9MICO|nr:glycosyltransferase [Agromyces larvae]UOE42755.1 glycosyltransferase [Agromyces larvae]
MGPELEGWDRTLVTALDGELVWPAAASSATVHRVAGVSGGDGVRCLLVTESLDGGGMDEFVAFLARQLPAFGVHAAVLLAPVGMSRGLGPIAQELAAEGIEVADPGDESEAWITRWKPDVMAVHGNAKRPLEIAAVLGVPAVLVLHGMHDLFDMPESEVVDRYDLLSGVICVSELVRTQYLARSSRIDPARVRTIVNGIDAQRTQGIDRAAARDALGLDDQFLFLSLSRHSMQKNTYGLVSAFGEVARDRANAHLLVCGRADDYSYTEQVLGLRERLPARDRIHLRGSTRRADVLLAAADAFVLDSFFEGWALSSMEALAAGVPVLMSDVGGAREQLAGGPTRGRLVRNPIGDPLAVNWETMSKARFAPQANRAEFVAAMSSFADREMDFADRETIAGDAVERFSAARCVASHAEALEAIARDGRWRRQEGIGDEH